MSDEYLDQEGMSDYAAICEEWGGRFGAFRAPELPDDSLYATIVRSINNPSDPLVSLVIAQPKEDGQIWQLLIREEDLKWVLEHPVDPGTT